jgi:hypothetical protein
MVRSLIGTTSAMSDEPTSTSAKELTTLRVCDLFTVSFMRLRTAFPPVRGMGRTCASRGVAAGPARPRQPTQAHTSNRVQATRLKPAPRRLITP